MRDAGLAGHVHVATDPLAVAAAAAEWLTDVSATTSPFRIALSGGTTPHFLYEALAASTFRNRIDWARWEIFFSDERSGPPDGPASNYRLVHDTLLAKVPVPPAAVHRVRAELDDLDAAAAEYSALLEERGGAPPRLDAVLLGLGSNGHTASLFPGTPALDVDDAWATRGLADYEPHGRVTLTFPVINAAARVAFVITGTGKEAALRGVIDGTVPAARVRPADGELHWFLDTAAARTVS